jgi:hypothetical protein
MTSSLWIFVPLLMQMPAFWASFSFHTVLGLAARWLAQRFFPSDSKDDFDKRDTYGRYPT